MLSIFGNVDVLNQIRRMVLIKNITEAFYKGIQDLYIKQNLNLPTSWIYDNRCKIL